jgi:hypothetical protein
MISRATSLDNGAVAAMELGQLRLGRELTHAAAVAGDQFA